MSDIITSITCDIREYYDRDLEQVKRLNKSAFIDYPWQDEDYVLFLRKRREGHKVYVADWREHVLGIMFFIQNEWNYELVALAVAPEFRSQGIGSQLVTTLKNQLVPYSREDIYTTVQWHNKDAHRFFNDQGFHTMDLVEGETGGCFKMKYELEEMPLKPEYRNR